MGIIKGGFLRIVQTLLYFIAFLCSAIILGIYSYFLAVQADRNAFISREEKAIEGLSGAATLYTIFATVLTCCLGGITFFAFIGIVLDICFVGSMIAIAVMTRNGSHSCRGFVYTPLGNGPASTHGSFDGTITYSVSLRTACRLETAVFAVSIVGAVVFAITALMQIPLGRHHKKEKRFGPSPANNYTSGSTGKRSFWNRKSANNGVARDAEMGTTGATLGAPAQDLRPSHETGYTGSTAATGTGANAYDKVDNTANPYAYDTTGAGQYTIGAGPAAGQHPYPTGAATNY